MSLKEELESAQVRHLDLSPYCLVGIGTPVRDVLSLMRRKKCRATLVARGDELVGIFTERDVLRKVALSPETLDRSVDEFMTPEPITIQPDMSAAAALWLMDEKNIRTLPVIDEEKKIVGNMTHAAVIRYLATRYPVEVLNRPPQPDHYPTQQEGG